MDTIRVQLLLLRKPTLLITTAKFLLPMSDYVMTWERRRLVIFVAPLYQSNALLRQELKRLQKYKGIKMVKNIGTARANAVWCLV